VGLGTAEEVVVQHGSSEIRPAGATCLGFLDFDEVVGLVRSARVVVCHAGVGSILVALTNGKRPVVVPRLAAHGEAVDDHQLALARRLHQAGLVSLVEDLTGLAAAVGGSDGSPAPSITAGTRLVDDLRHRLESIIAAPAVPDTA
jgi:UDP-N-acetylglucosamine transferase subunit ALG13